MNRPLVSVVLPVFNGGRHLSAAVQSLLDQDYPHLQIVALDDGSTDASLAVLRAFAAADPRIEVVTRENRGLIATLNEGLARAKGELIARMDADDLAYPARIRRQVAAFAANPALVMCATDFDIVSDHDWVRPSHVPVCPDADLAVLSRFFTVFRHSTVMFNRAALPSQVLRYDAAYPYAEDFDLFRRVTQAGPTHIIPEPLLAYRVHAGSVTLTRAREMRRTHLAIVQENIAALGEQVDLPELLEGRSGSPVAEIAEIRRLMAAVDKVVARQPAAERAAYEAGKRAFFFFLLDMALRERGAGFAADLLDDIGGWSLVRRRERYAINSLRRAPQLATFVWSKVRALEDLRGVLAARPMRRAAFRPLRVGPAGLSMAR